MAITKHEMVRIFLNQAKAASACGVTRGAVTQWPEDLPQRISDQVIGAAIRTGTPIPEDIFRKFKGLEPVTPAR